MTSSSRSRFSSAASSLSSVSWRRAWSPAVPAASSSRSRRSAGFASISAPMRPWLDHCAGMGAGRGVGEQQLDVARAHVAAVDSVGRAVAALDPAGDLDFRAVVEGERRVAVAVVEGQRDFGDVAGRSCRSPGEDNIVHLAAAQASGRGLAHHPAQRLDQVRFAAAVRPDDPGEARLDRQLRRVDKGFEPDEAEPRDLHQKTAESRRLMPRLTT